MKNLRETVRMTRDEFWAFAMTGEENFDRLERCGLVYCKRFGGPDVWPNQHELVAIQDGGYSEDFENFLRKYFIPHKQVKFSGPSSI